MYYSPMRIAPEEGSKDNPGGHKLHGRPRRTWIQDVESDLEELTVELSRSKREDGSPIVMDLWWG